MSEHFIILGLPRSMTAWVSCFLTCGDVFCQHELSGKYPDREDWPDLIRQPYPVSGVCDSGLTTSAEWLQREFPNARYATIWRDKESWRKSMQSIGLSETSTEAIEHSAINALALLCSSRPENFTFDDLQTEEGARRLWEYCAPSVPLPPAHLAKMMTLKVTVHPKVYAEAAQLLNSLTA